MAPTGTTTPPRRKTNNSGVFYQGRKASISLKFVIVGGGITGLASAFALKHAGHDVLVLESAETVQRNYSGMHMPPNLTKLLYQWGLGNEVNRLAQFAEGLEFVHYTTGQKIGELHWADDVLEAFGADYPVISHADLYKIIYEAAIRIGVPIRFNSKVASIDPEEPSVTLLTGEVIHGDIIIGADGPQSLVRTIVNGDELDEDLTTRGTVIFTGVIPGELLQDDPELNHYLNFDGTIIWRCSQNRHAVGYPVSSRKEYALHILNVEDETPESYWEIRPKPSEETELQKNVEGCAPQLRKLVNLFPSVLRTKYVTRPHAKKWVHDGGNIILIGEAAHPILPCIAEGAALGLEDSVILGTLFSHYIDEFQIPIFLQAYQDLREERCREVQRNERNTVTWFQTGFDPNGPEVQALLESLHASSVKNPGMEEGLLEQWEDCKYTYAYDAYDAAETWYVEWGILHERSRLRMWKSPETQPSSNMFSVQVSVSETDKTESDAFDIYYGEPISSY